MTRLPFLKVSVAVLVLIALGGTALPVWAATEVSPGLTPNSPFYFLDTLAERISLYLTFDTQAKAERALVHAEEKIAELNSLPDEKKEIYLRKVSDQLNHYLKLAETETAELETEEGPSEAVTKKVLEVAGRHQVVLQRVYENAPEEVQAGITQALRNSQQLQERIQTRLEIRKEDGSGPIIQNLNQLTKDSVSDDEWSTRKDKLVTRIDSLKELVQGDLTAEDQEKLLGILDQLEDVINQAPLSEEQKSQLAAAIDQLGSLVESGLTPAQKIVAVAALESLKNQIENLSLEDVDIIGETLKEKIAEETDTPTNHQIKSLLQTIQRKLRLNHSD